MLVNNQLSMNTSGLIRLSKFMQLKILLAITKIRKRETILIDVRNINSTFAT